MIGCWPLGRDDGPGVSHGMRIRATTPAAEVPLGRRRGARLALARNDDASLEATGACGRGPFEALLLPSTATGARCRVCR